MHHLVGVGILHGLADLSEDGEPCDKGRAESLFSEPQIERLPRLVVVVSETDSKLGLDEVLRAEDAVVMQAVERYTLAYQP